MDYEEFLLQLKKAKRPSYDDEDDWAIQGRITNVIMQYLIERDKPNDNRTNSSS